MKEKLYRSRTNRVIGGVASGLGDYLNLDPVLVRIIFVILVLVNSVGFWLYIILWIIIPEEGSEQSEFEKRTASAFTKSKSYSETNHQETDTNASAGEVYVKSNSGSGRVIAGVILILVGLIFTADNIFPYLDFEDFLPVLLIVFGVVILWNGFKK